MSQFLSEASQILAAPRDPATSLQQLARAAVPALADFCLIFLRDGADIRCAASAHVTTQGASLLRRLLSVYRITEDDPFSTVALAIRTSRPQLRSAIALEAQARAARAAVLTLHRRLGCRSALVVPVGVMPHARGALSLCYSTSAREYSTQDVAPARHVAALIERFLREHADAPPPPMGRRQVRLRARV
jgi:hypothetical protein